MNVSPKMKTAIYAAAGIVLLAVIVTAVWYLTRPRYNLRAAYVTSEPKLDGIGNDAVWTKAQEVTIPVNDKNQMTVKAVYTGDKVFFQARFKDATKDDIDEPWTYDGKKWHRGRTSDQFALFFDIDNSIKDFDTKGFGVMTYGFKPHYKLWQFGITGPVSKNGDYWDGFAQRADVWMMHSSISSPWGMGDDGYFAVMKQYMLNPTMTEPRMWVQWDAFTTPGILGLNTTIWQQAKLASDTGLATPVATETPYLKYADPKKNLKNTPYPFEDELTPITDYSAFKKGDMLPWVYFDRAAKGKWGGSRDDITGKMAYKDGYWTVEMGRKINTGFADDIRFRPADGKEILFGVLVRTDGTNIRYTVPAKLTFAPKGGN
jgi:hypothetical protein